MPTDLQDEITWLMLGVASDAQSIVELSDEEALSLRKSMEQARHGEFASDDEVLAVWAAYDSTHS